MKQYAIHIVLMLMQRNNMDNSTKLIKVVSWTNLVPSFRLKSKLLFTIKGVIKSIIFDTFI